MPNEFNILGVNSSGFILKLKVKFYLWKMSSLSIISSWKKNIFKPIYWLEGEEEYFIDEIMEYAEKKILSEEDASFNLTIFYGRDADWVSVVNACRRYPMFAERQVVLLKEAQHMRDLDKMEGYIANPSPTTTFVASYKGKTLDGRSKTAKLLKKNGEVFVSKKIYENQVPAWTNGYIQSRGFQIAPKALSLLVDHVGNDLSRIVNEIEKLSLNAGAEKIISENDIEKYIGISKDYNLFELQQALSTKDRVKAMQIIQYLESNPKAIPIQMALPSLYSYFTRIMVAFQVSDKSERGLMPLFYNNPFLVKQALVTMRNYSLTQLQFIILLLHEYNLKSIGINSSNNVSAASLLKELTFKITKVA